MISILTGKLLEITPPQIILSCGGVGYELDLPISHIAQLPAIGHELQLYTHLVIREDAHLLFGFINKTERDCFRQLIKVSGIGPRIALALLSTMSSQQLQQAIEEADLNTLCLTPGIGKKMAERMLLELKGKLVGNIDFTPTNGLFNNKANDGNIRKDIATALESLGYNSKEITQVIKQLPELTDISQGIKEALKLLGK
ncbi:Holliday junction branch migration protein RuvA [Aquella oligotrophica]|uniref:Holliday junction branch migration complex subunit RuvA n=1 Tax=Aquella oligotrophica TaxID=2067065 RepID=A0A2I7N6Z8_9NEIS|nr:Holliday junction branch migration protein RuvA [Aquella oligotrophica]AUR52247.1 Holliday junction branch migration protein RuvA [Aquella oligotrophica]